MKVHFWEKIEAITVQLLFSSITRKILVRDIEFFYFTKFSKQFLKT